MKLLIFLFFSIAISFDAFSQSKIELRIEDDNATAIENATVQLLKAKDSSLVKAALSDKNGLAEFIGILPGSYLIKVSYLNHPPGFSQVFSIKENHPTFVLPPIKLIPAVGTLKEVSITTKKPFIQKLSDRIVVNVDNSIVNAGSSAMEVLERSPGVSIDQNDVIGLRGKQGVRIMIDGKITPMTGADLANYLRGLPSSVIDRIDIITNPSAKYDASGNSGIIDIHMKKDQRVGLNGTFTAGCGQGVYPKANTGATFNYRNKKINLFGNYNFAYRKNLNQLVLDRNFYTNVGVFQGEDNKDNFTTFPITNNAARFGMDYFPNKKTIIGFVLNGNLSKIDKRNDNNSLVIDDQRKPISKFQAFGHDQNHQNNGLANVNFKHTFDSTGKEITIDVDYGSYSSGSLSSTDTHYYNLDGTTAKPTYILQGDQSDKLILRTAKADLTYPLRNAAKFEAGTKLSYVSSDNDAKFFDASNGTLVNDVNKTNHFLYDEYNYAGYFNYNKVFKKFDFQIGLRGEQSQVKTHQLRGDLKFDTSYFKLFPSAFFNYKIKEQQTLGISVSRRIDRPGYADLNPFLYLIDVSTYATKHFILLQFFPMFIF